MESEISSTELEIKNMSNSLKGTIIGYKEPMAEKIELLLKSTKIFNKKPSLKQIFIYKDNQIFLKEIQNQCNNNFITYCFFRKNKIYEFGELKIVNNILTFEKNNIELLLYINFDLITCKLLLNKKNKNKFKILILSNSNTIVTKFKFENISKENFKSICNRINKIIILSKGYKENIFLLDKNFLLSRYISLIDFVNKANSFDIILFKSFSKMSKIQRLITCAQYDHVAVLFRSRNSLYVFEASEEKGVQLIHFTDYINLNYFLLYEKIAYRKFYMFPEINKNIFYELFNFKMIKFISNTINKKYELKFKGILFKMKMKDNVDKRDSYFCSELIAALYYYCGIISNEIDCSNYLPGNFAESGGIYFNKGFFLGYENIIDFGTI